MRIKENQYVRIKLQQLCFLSCVGKMAQVMPYSQSIVSVKALRRRICSRLPEGGKRLPFAHF